MTTVTLLMGLAVTTDVAHAETRLMDTVAWDADDPALPSTNEPSTEPQVPEGSFDIPSPNVFEDPPPVEPIVPPPVGSAVEEWQKSSHTPEGLDAFRQSRTSTSNSAPSSGEIANRATESERASGGDAGRSDVKAFTKRERLAQQVGRFIRGLCLGVLTWVVGDASVGEDLLVEWSHHN